MVLDGKLWRRLLFELREPWSARMSPEAQSGAEMREKVRVGLEVLASWGAIFSVIAILLAVACYGCNRPVTWPPEPPRAVPRPQTDVCAVPDRPEWPCRKHNARGLVIRDKAMKQRFKSCTGYPHGRPGFVVDHVVPLCAGGCDVISNLRWQPVAEAKAKDRIERAMCAGRKS